MTLFEDGSAQVVDDGRGIPVDIHPKKKIPAVQVIFTTLHSGGKFRKTDKDAAYRIAGGLHGVGVCVTNALAKRVEVEIARDGARHRLIFADNGKVKEPLKKIGAAAPRESGTRVRFWPDPKYFDSPQIVVADVAALLRAKAMQFLGLGGVMAMAVDDHEDVALVRGWARWGCQRGSSASCSAGTGRRPEPAEGPNRPSPSATQPMRSISASHRRTGCPRSAWRE